MTIQTQRFRGCVRCRDGTRLAYQVEGPADAPAVLLLQGQANSHRWWRRLRSGYSDRSRTITFDYRGTGSTTIPEAMFDDLGSWSTRSFADDAAAVLHALGYARAHVFGTSMGGRVAQELALRHPQLVDRLVLACTSPGGDLGVERSVATRQLLAQSDPELRQRATFDLFYRRKWIERHGGYTNTPTDLCSATRG